MRQRKYQEGNPVVRFLLRRFFARVEAVLRESGARAILDAGCGEGELLHRGTIAKSAVFLDRDREVLSCIAASGRVCGSVLTLPFAPASFDAAVCLEVLEHLQRPADALNELARVARQDVIVSVPWEPWFRLGNLARGKYIRDLGNFPEHVQHWNPRTLRAFLAPHFAEVRITTAFPWLIARCRLLIPGQSTREGQ